MKRFLGVLIIVLLIMPIGLADDVDEVEAFIERWNKVSDTYGVQELSVNDFNNEDNHIRITSDNWHMEVYFYNRFFAIGCISSSDPSTFLQMSVMLGAASPLNTSDKNFQDIKAYLLDMFLKMTYKDEYMGVVYENYRYYIRKYNGEYKFYVETMVTY